MRGEIDPRPALRALARRGYTPCLPAIASGRLVFRAARSALPSGTDGAAQLVRGRFGTLEPSARLPVCRPDILLVPLAAFDLRGQRIGYGGGYYDRYIARQRASAMPPLCIGLAFACQRVAFVPALIHDEALDAIATEAGVHVSSQLSWGAARRRSTISRLLRESAGRP